MGPADAVEFGGCPGRGHDAVSSLEVGFRDAAEPTVEGGASAGIDRGWPVAAPLAGLLPTGMLRRGSVVPVLGSTSLLWAMISVASRAGAWVAVVGMPEAGAVAAAEQGVVLERLALTPHLGELWPTVVAALLRYIDGWYNPRRIQEGLGGLSPDEYEEVWHRQGDPAMIHPEPEPSR